MSSIATTTTTTTQQPCEHDRYFSCAVRVGVAFRVFHQIVNPRGDERDRLVRNLNRRLEGKPPCQCERCRTSLDAYFSTAK